MMKSTIYITLFLCIGTISNIQAQNEKDIVFENLNKIRKGYDKRAFRLDTSLVKSTEIIKKINVKEEKINKDSLRSILRSNGNFDYNVEYIETSFPKTKKSDKILVELQDKKFKKILSDSLYNHIGVSLNKGVFKNKLRVLATQSYIQFDDEFQIVFKNTSEGYKQYNVVSGKSNINSIRFNTYKYDKNYKKLKNENETVKLDSSNRFEITVDITKNGGKPMDIEVIDSKGKIVSYIRNK